MTRASPLSGLSAQHAEAILIGRQLLQLSSNAGDALQARWEQLRQRFHAEVEPHFRLEEEELLPVLDDLGESELVTRTWEDHEALRELVLDSNEPLATRLERLGLRLLAHVHFEETELFEVARRRLAPEVLARIARHAPPPPPEKTGTG
jgi:hemerythrin-like domain-containing protein